jgi:hypothetical protein
MMGRDKRIHQRMKKLAPFVDPEEVCPDGTETWKVTDKLLEDIEQREQSWAERGPERELDREQLKADAERYLQSGTPKHRLASELHKWSRYSEFNRDYLRRVLDKIGIK